MTTTISTNSYTTNNITSTSTSTSTSSFTIFDLLPVIPN
jgi:hypothetical protein